MVNINRLQCARGKTYGQPTVHCLTLKQKQKKTGMEEQDANCGYTKTVAIPCLVFTPQSIFRQNPLNEVLARSLQWYDRCVQ